ncbi:MAG TPA: DUF4124 domain-containing protein [Steroidobacter sp.]|uniref:DUF4124 domain-containing protein n=1 Tax=Steroidobacter sp. TaxID=1978227 RepID=UPI002EDA65DA
MFRRLLLLTVAAAPLAAGTAIADVYKYIDEKGNVQYTDKPPVLPAERLNVKSQSSDVVAAQDRPQTQQPAASSRPTNTAKDEREAAAATAKDKAERCIKARERYDKYMTSQKLYEEGKDGERRYLDSAELDAARASAKTAMDVMCQ